MSSLLFTFALSLLGTWALVRVASKLGLLDRVFVGEQDRKPSRGDVPVVGGVAIVISLLAARIFFGEAPASAAGEGGFSEAWTWGAILCAFGVGLGDDRFGFRPRVKLLGQATAGLCLAVPILLESESVGFGGALFEALAWFLGAMIAQNAINTFDNADGAASSVVASALILPSPVAAAAIVGFLPFNLSRREHAKIERPILGDAGSHVLGILLLLNPVAWPVLALPLLDLARVSIVRVRRGIAPWVGDRRHLAHRLELAGFSPVQVVCALLAIALPTALVPFLESSVWALASSVLLTTVLFASAVRFSPNPDQVKVLRSAPPRRDDSRANPVLHGPLAHSSVVPPAVPARPRSASSLAR